MISCFNYGTYLTEAIASLRAQAGGAPKAIVVDDGSTDTETVDILDDLGEGVTVVRQDNQGASAARNAGLRLVDTPYALVLDADDMLERTAIDRLKTVLRSNRDLGYAYGYIQFFGRYSGLLRMPEWDPWRLMFRHIVGPTALMRTEMVRAVGGYDLTLPHYEDWDIWLNGLANGLHGHRIDAPTLLYRKHGRSKFDADRANYRYYARRLRDKYPRVYGQVHRMAELSALSAGERAFYRWFWGARPWPARAESALYALAWRRESLRTS